MHREKREGIVLEIQRLSTEDGPGIRTTVFLKGCSLNCTWCHNPESIPFVPQIQWIEANCIYCGICVQTCAESALKFQGENLKIDRLLCTGCGKCSEECPTRAMELLGKKWTAHELVNEMLKDRAYFEKSGGGVTLSGGEALLQTDFIYEVAKRLKEEGIHMALDTCGQCPQDSFKLLLPYIDLVLYDLKEIDPVKHKEYTSFSNEQILENLKYVGTVIKNSDHVKKLWIRTPIIPDATDSEGNIQGIGEFISTYLSGVVDRWELCAFNNLCQDKYLRLDLDWLHKEAELLSSSILEILTATARNSGVDPLIVQASGSTKKENSYEV
jgi:pyruvate formate lyase activating enzyme